MTIEYSEDHFEGNEIEGNDIEGAKPKRAKAIFKNIQSSIRKISAPIFRSVTAAVASGVNCQPQIQSLQNRINTLNVEIQRLKNTVNDYTNQINEYRRTISGKDTQIKQLNATIFRLEGEIETHLKTIDEQKKQIAQLTRENTRLKKKNNAILDTVQYYRSQVNGNKKVDGYSNVVVKQQIEVEKLKAQEIGNPISKTTSDLKKEGFVTQENATYNTVYTQNQTIQNQIENENSKQSIDNQLAINIMSKINTMQTINKIMLVLFLAAFAYGSFKIFTNNTLGVEIRAGIVIAMFLSVIILHSIEYILAYIVTYSYSFITGTPYKFNRQWATPGIYDYLPMK